MWGHKATQNNLKTLLSYGYKFIGPGDMACGNMAKEMSVHWKYFLF